MAAEIPVEVREEVLPDVIRRYAAGASMRELEKEHGVSRRTLYRWLFSAIGEEAYRELVTDALIARIAEADEELDGAGSVLEVTKRKEIARFARMDFERRRPALYGVKQEVKHTGATVFRIEYAEMPAGGRVIEGTPVASALSAPAEGDVK